MEHRNDYFRRSSTEHKSIKMNRKFKLFSKRKEFVAEEIVECRNFDGIESGVDEHPSFDEII